MRQMYESADAHIAFAQLAGAVPAGATKDSHPLVRKAYKTVSLGCLYGQSEYGIAARLGISQSRARAMLVQHHDLFPTYWDWSERVVQAAFDRGEMRTPCGWSSRVPKSSNVRTWMNFPIQATGGDVMRLVVTYLDRQGVDLLAVIHDGFLVSCCATNWRTSRRRSLGPVTRRWSRSSRDSRYAGRRRSTRTGSMIRTAPPCGPVSGKPSPRSECNIQLVQCPSNNSRQGVPALHSQYIQQVDLLGVDLRGDDSTGGGVWLPAAVVATLPRLDLSPPSRQQVFLAVLLEAARRQRGGSDQPNLVAELSVADLCASDRALSADGEGCPGGPAGPGPGGARWPLSAARAPPTSVQVYLHTAGAGGGSRTGAVPRR